MCFDLNVRMPLGVQEGMLNTRGASENVDTEAHTIMSMGHKGNEQRCHQHRPGPVDAGIVLRRGLDTRALPQSAFRGLSTDEICKKAVSSTTAVGGVQGSVFLWPWRNATTKIHPSPLPLHS